MSIVSIEQHLRNALWFPTDACRSRGEYSKAVESRKKNFSLSFHTFVFVDVER